MQQQGSESLPDAASNLAQDLLQSCYGLRLLYAPMPKVARQYPRLQRPEDLSYEATLELLADLGNACGGEEFQDALLGMLSLHLEPAATHQEMAKLLGAVWKEPLKKFGFAIHKTTLQDLLRAVRAHLREPGVRESTWEVELRVCVRQGTLFGAKPGEEAAEEAMEEAAEEAAVEKTGEEAGGPGSNLDIAGEERREEAAPPARLQSRQKLSRPPEVTVGKLEVEARHLCNALGAADESEGAAEQAEPEASEEEEIQGALPSNGRKDSNDSIPDADADGKTGAKREAKRKLKELSPDELAEAEPAAPEAQDVPAAREEDEEVGERKVSDDLDAEQLEAERRARRAERRARRMAEEGEEDAERRAKRKAEKKAKRAAAEAEARHAELEGGEAAPRLEEAAAQAEHVPTDAEAQPPVGEAAATPSATESAAAVEKDVAKAAEAAEAPAAEAPAAEAPAAEAPAPAADAPAPAAEEAPAAVEAPAAEAPSAEASAVAPAAEEAPAAEAPEMPVAEAPAPVPEASIPEAPVPEERAAEASEQEAPAAEASTSLDDAPQQPTPPEKEPDSAAPLAADAPAEPPSPQQDLELSRQVTAEEAPEPLAEEPEAKPEPMEEVQPEPAVTPIFQEAVEFEVACAEAVGVYAQPEVQATEVGQLQPGAVVVGQPRGDWLKLEAGGELCAEMVGRWVFIGRHLVVKDMKTTVVKQFAEAVRVTWPPLPAANVVYAVECRPLPSAAAGRQSLRRGRFRGSYVLAREPEATVPEMPSGTTVQVRVVARVGGADPAVKLLGPWCEAAAGSALPEELEEDPKACVDGNGTARGPCLESKCYRYLRKEGDDDDGLCTRCGHPAEDHLEGPEDAADIPPSAVSSFTVEISSAQVLSARSLDAKRVGDLARGEMIRGRQEGKWLRLAETPPRWGTGHSLPAAWVIMDGRKDGCGHVLTPYVMATVQEPRASEVLSQPPRMSELLPQPLSPRHLGQRQKEMRR